MSLVGRLGRDSDLRYTPSGAAVLNLAVAYNYGQKDQSGKKPSQWVDCALFGKRAEALAQHLIKGTQVFLVLDDVHIRTFTKQDQTPGFTLSGTVSKVEFVGNAPQQQAKAPAPAPTPRPQQPAAFDNFDDNAIPF